MSTLLGPDLRPGNAWIFRITHIRNLAWILTNGLHCRNGMTDPNFIDIGNPDLITKRAVRGIEEAPGGTLSDYVPFYFTPYSPMLLNIKTGYNGIKQRPMDDLVIMMTSLHQLTARGITFLFTDRHANLQTAEYTSDLNRLDMIDWKILQARDFKRNPDDPGKVERYQAEALVHRWLPIDALLGIACYSKDRETELRSLIKQVGVDCKAGAKPEWYH